MSVNGHTAYSTVPAAPDCAAFASAAYAAAAKRSNTRSQPTVQNAQTQVLSMSAFLLAYNLP